MSIRARRLPPEQSRSAALDAARAILLEQGPQAVTLKAVAARVGRTHANLIHHFGSAAELQSALAGHIADRVTSSIGDAVQRARSGATDAREVVDRTFDAFGREGAGALAAWMIVSGDRDALDPILQSLRGLVAELSVGRDEHHVAETTLWLVLAALGDSLLGESIAAALQLPADTARAMAAERIAAALSEG
ncbi:TetR/AcrR family transcriptional regulator [Sphingomonas sabuli]|uniref:TetR/AcrR family transcriptional regulator n=1 Tax=Sphingomonas sabuli TaxID=2764186 RepID=A0A7G9L042_9SPHN|nr:TetR/AcrR family transcriptional regulator [Sphingomonas sabuli]QNM81991.1 TetR/AcrR family transcriptional regulator [Sphingomonas sabuli]